MSTEFINEADIASIDAARILLEAKHKTDEIEVIEKIVEVKSENPKPSDGYLSESDYQRKHGSLDGFKSKEQFDKDGSFFRKIEAQNKKIDELIEFNKQTLDHAKKVEKAAKEQALKDLQLQKIEAIKLGDLNGVNEVERQSEAIKEELSVAQQSPVVPLSEEAKAFKQRNTWLSGTSSEDLLMQEEALLVLNQLKRLSPDISEDAVIQKIEAKVKLNFPHRFENPNKSQVQLTTTSTVSNTISTSDSLGDRLTAQQKEFVKKARSYGSKLTNEEYAKQLELTGDLVNG